MIFEEIKQGNDIFERFLSWSPETIFQGSQTAPNDFNGQYILKKNKEYWFHYVLYFLP